MALSHAFFRCLKSLESAGYSFDYVSDHMIAELTAATKKGRPRKVLVIPPCRFMPATTLAAILQYARSGGKVVFQALPADVPGLSSLQDNRTRIASLLKEIETFRKSPQGNAHMAIDSSVVSGLKALDIQRETLLATGLLFTRRNIAGGKLYFVVNHSGKRVDAGVPFRYASGEALLLDPQSGRYGRAPVTGDEGEKKIRLQLEPGEAMFIQIQPKLPAAPTWQYLSEKGTAVNWQQPWSLRFTAGGPQLPGARQLNELISWTALPDSSGVAFSGSSEYSSTFILTAPLAPEYLLDLGQVFESAHIWINGKDAGYLWSFPYRLRVKAWLKAGRNTIRIEVANLMANRIRDMDRRHISWRNYHEINFVNIHYQPFNAADWQPRVSGLLGPVTLTPVQTTFR